MTLEQTDPNRPRPKQIAKWLYMLGRYLRAEGERESAIESITKKNIYSHGILREADEVTKEANEIWEEH